jgi:hypothetical protein
VGASGEAWPFFLVLIADSLGASIQPCGWYTAHGGGVPGFNGTYSNPDGDGPCWLPGNATSTRASGFLHDLASTSAEGWDAFEEEALNLPEVQPSVQWSDIGSGPYHVENPMDGGAGDDLHANPEYAAPVGWAGQPGCLPRAGAFVPNVRVVWEASGDSEGLSEMASGQADSAGFFSSEIPTVLSTPRYLLHPGIPGLFAYFDGLNLNFNVAGAQQDDNESINVPGTFFQNVALRPFMVLAYPYVTTPTSESFVDGLQYGEPYGGAIPHDLGNDYPENISWPNGNPVPNASVVGNVTWRWAEATNESSPWFDPQLSKCTVAVPGEWPMFYPTGNAPEASELEDWDSEGFNLSRGVLAPNVIPVGTEGCFPESGCSPVYSEGGWYADSPDPSDFMTPMYSPDNSYTEPDSVSKTLSSAPNNASTCPHDYAAGSNLTYRANVGEIPTDGQGAAYGTMATWIDAAEYLPNLPLRTLEYNLIEPIADELALYVYDGQAITWVDYADWIEGTSLNSNPMIGGEGIQLWYGWGYASNYFDVTYAEFGVPVGANWSITLAGNTTTATAPAPIVFGPVLNGTYPYEVGPVSGRSSSPTGGDLVVDGASDSPHVTFTCLGSESYPVNFHETGLEPGSAWAVQVVGDHQSISVHGETPTLNVSLAAGNYSYTPGQVAGYSTPPPGIFTVSSAPIPTITLAYESESQWKYGVKFLEVGLPTGSPWSVALNGSTLSGSNATLATQLPNGSYAGGLVSWPSGYPAAPTGGVLTVDGGPVQVEVLAAAHSEPPTEQGPPGTYLSPLAWIALGGIGLVGSTAGVILGGWAVPARPRRENDERPPPPR